MRSAVESATRKALASGALEPIETKTSAFEHCGVEFIVRVVSSLARKKVASKVDDPLGNYEPDLFVCDVSASHYVLLNKYNALPHHVLIVTRAFEPQEAALTELDFEALTACMAGFGDVGFYNGGIDAGASQPRKHLQLVPMAPIPIEPALGKLPFRHAFAALGRLDPAALHKQYLQMLQPGKPYNLLVTRRWMLYVPRARECFESLTVNALGFAGSLFARTEEQAKRIREFGPMNVLRHVTAA